MDNTELTILLKEMLVGFNKEARLVSPRLEAEMCLALDRVGGKWVLAGLQAQVVEGAEEVERTPDNFRKLVGTGEGQKLLKSAIEGNRAGVREMRRKVVGLIRALAPEGPGLSLKVEPAQNPGGIYDMLLRRQKDRGER